MGFRYFWGSILANIYRFIRVFPNSDPIMGFILPAAKNEAWWKAPLFAFATMFTFDFFTSGIGSWTWVTASTYALIALAFRFYFRERKAGLKVFMGAGAAGTLAFDFITGPVAISLLHGQQFFLTLALQVPFTIMHLVSVSFSIIIITPFLDKEVAKEVSGAFAAAKNFIASLRLNL